MFGFTCNYCGETVHGNDYVEHVEMHDREDGTPPKGEAPPSAHVEQRERAYWRRTFAREQSEILGR